MIFNEQGFLDIDGMIAAQPSFQNIMADGIVTEEELHQQGCVPAQLHIGGGNPPEHRDPPVKGGGAEETDQGGEKDTGSAGPQGQPGGFPVERQNLVNVSPIHCASSFPDDPA